MPPILKSPETKKLLFVFNSLLVSQNKSAVPVFVALLNRRSPPFLTFNAVPPDPPLIVNVPPIFKFSPTPTPPLTVRAPLPVESDEVVFVILTCPLKVEVSLLLICLLNVTGPSN